MSFQKTVNRTLPRGVAGDFANINPRNSVPAGEGSLVAAEDITVGQFAFADPATGKVYQAPSAGRIRGFVHRNAQAIIGYGEEASMIIPTGRGVNLYAGGDFLVVAPAVVAAGDAVKVLDATGALSGESVGVTDTGFKYAAPAEAGAIVTITRYSI